MLEAVEQKLLTKEPQFDWQQSSGKNNGSQKTLKWYFQSAEKQKG